MSDELLPCPFHAGEACEPPAVVRRPRYFTVECFGCGTEGPARDTAEEAFSAWNRRATPTTDRDAVLEEAARVADKADRDCATQEWTAETIRALKATPAPITPSAVDEADEPWVNRRNAAWLRENSSAHEGNWVALRNGDLVAEHKSRRALVHSLRADGRLVGVTLVPLFVGASPVAPGAVDEAERRGAERERAAVVADLELLANANAMAAHKRDMAVPDLYTRTSRYCRDLARRYREGRHIPPATESEAGRG